MKLYCDGALNRICYVFEGHQPIILELPKKVTNNMAEYIAIVKGLEAAIRLRWKDITIISDSQLVVRQLNSEYAIKKEHLGKLAAQVWKLALQLDKVEFKWVKRDMNLAGIALEVK